MPDDILSELWNTKDTIAKEHGYSIDGLAEYYLKKQTTSERRFYPKKKAKKAEQAA